MSSFSPVARPSLINQALAALTQQRIVALVGIPGSGKSTLARLLVDQLTSPPYLLWATLGPTFTTYQHDIVLIDWWHQFGVQSDSQTIRAEVLRAAWPASATVVVCDDVWEEAHVAQLQAAIPDHVRIIITTRFADVAVQCEAAQIACDPLLHSEALALFAAHCDQPLSAFVDQAWVSNMLATLSYHPLSIQLWSTYLRQASADPRDWPILTDDLIHSHTAEPIWQLSLYPQIGAQLTNLFAQNYARLHPMQRQILHSFVALAPGSDVPTEFIAHMWQISIEQAHATLRALARDALIVPGISDAMWSQHPIMRVFTQTQVELVNGDEPIITRYLQTIHHYMAVASETHHFHRHFMHHQFETAFELALRYNHPIAVAIVDDCANFHDAHNHFSTQYAWSKTLYATLTDQSDNAVLQMRANVLVADAAIDMAISVGQQRRAFLLEAQQHLDAAHTICQAIAADPELPVILGQLGVVHQELANTDPAQFSTHINDAIRIYEDLVHLPGLNATTYVARQQDLANCYIALAETQYPNGVPALNRAVAACHDALVWIPLPRKTVATVQIYATLSMVYHDLAAQDPVNRRAHLQNALDANDTAIAYVLDVDDPHRHGIYLMNRGNLYVSMSELLDVDHYELYQSALECYTEALTIRTAEAVPHEYSWTQHNLAHLCLHAAHTVGFDCYSTLIDGLHANDEALRFRTIAESPLYHALTHYVRALILRDLAELLDDDPQACTTWLTDAIHSIGVAQSIYAGNSSNIHAACLDVHAALLIHLARHQATVAARATLQQALQLSNQALGVFLHDSPDDVAEVYLNRMHLFAAQSRLAVDTHELLTHVVDAFAKAIQQTDSARQPLLSAQMYHGYAHIVSTSVLIEHHAAAAINYAWQAHALAQRLHHATMITRTINTLLGLRERIGTDTFGMLWHQHIDTPRPDWLN